MQVDGRLNTVSLEDALHSHFERKRHLGSHSLSALTEVSCGRQIGKQPPFRIDTLERRLGFAHHNRDGRDREEGDQNDRTQTKRPPIPFRHRLETICELLAE